ISIVFFPVVFLSSIGKFLFTPLALSVIFAICTSRLLATTLVPVCAAKFLRPKTSRMQKAEKTEALAEESGAHPLNEEPSAKEEETGWFTRVRRVYQCLLEPMLRFRRLVLFGVAVLFIVSMLLFKFIGTELFPQTDAGQFMIRMRATPGLRIEYTEKLTSRVEEVVRSTIPDRERKMIIANIGVLYDWPAAYTPNSGSQDAFIL